MELDKLFQKFESLGFSDDEIADALEDYFEGESHGF